MCVCVCVCVCVCACMLADLGVCGFYLSLWLGGGWQDAALMRGSFKGPIPVCAPADQSTESFAEIQPLLSLCLSM